jgi:predicted lipoprotein
VSSALTPSRRNKGPGLSRTRLIWLAIVVIALVGLSRGVKVVGIDSAAGANPAAFSAVDFGKSEFPKVQEAITKRAVPAPTLATALAANSADATQKYGIADPGGLGPEMAVSFTGVVGAGTNGVYTVTVAGVPADLVIRVQTGPAINGTDLRDAAGTITFGQFTNQIDYQNAGSALNDQLKQQVLSKIDASNLTGKTISVVGAFELINPKGWLVTPVTLSVQ